MKFLLFQEKNKNDFYPLYFRHLNLVNEIKKATQLIFE